MFSKKNNRCYDMSDMMWQADMNMDMDFIPNMKSNKNYGMDKKDNMKMNKKGMMCEDPVMGCKMQPVYECPVENCVHRTICHEVPHVCPINTKIINHHVYRHTYSPCYTCCEENDVCHVNEGSCCCFR